MKVKTKDKIVLLESLIALSEINIILNNFLKTMRKKSIKKVDGNTYLHGSFMQGATVSGRMASKKPNLMNMPSTGSVYAKAVKKCFIAPRIVSKGFKWFRGTKAQSKVVKKRKRIMVGADYTSLEAKVLSLISRDKNLLKVYTQGFDSHCLRAYFYYSKSMPKIRKKMALLKKKGKFYKKFNKKEQEWEYFHESEIKGEYQEVTKKEFEVGVINSIAWLYEKLRQKSKSPSFLLFYAGTFVGLMRQFGMTKKEAKHLEKQFHLMYGTYDSFIAKHIKKASKKGFVVGAFGLRLRTPIIKQVMWGSGTEPYEAHKEAKTAGNMLGQSYGLLNSRSTNYFMWKVWHHWLYKYLIEPIAQIHDASYYLTYADVDLIHWMNKTLIKEMEWQELPELAHKSIKLGGELCIYYPDWSNEIKIPNNATKKDIKKILKTHELV